jgi:hypothetical protein
VPDLGVALRAIVTRETDVPDGTYRLGVDIGGTFTDLVLLEEAEGGLRVLKVPSTPADPAAAVLQGTRTVLARPGVSPEAVVLFIHGTTLAVNTLLQRSGDPVGLIVTRGFRDILELRRLRLREAQNFHMDKPEALVPRHLVREVGERLLASGEIYRSLPADAVAAVSVVQPLMGGSGARPIRDGVDGIDYAWGFLRNVPAETIESEMPILIERYALRPDSGWDPRAAAATVIRASASRSACSPTSGRGS